MKIKTAKARAWKAFSLYIRTRDCLATTGDPTRGRCFTSDKEYPLEELDAGHFIPGRHNANLFYEKGCHAQSRYDNRYLYGRQYRYSEKLIKMYGKGVIKELFENDKKYLKFTAKDLLEREEEYIRRTKEICA